jgi:cell volume regulation protein A
MQFSVLLVLCALVLLAGVLLYNVSFRLGIPVLIAFILLGMFFGADGLFKIDFSNYEAASDICSAALALIIFSGGFSTRWQSAKKGADRAILLSTAGVILTAAGTAAFCHFIVGFTPAESFLVGSVTGSTDAASVFSVLRSKNLSLKDDTASVLELESGSNDPAAALLMFIALSFLTGTASFTFITRTFILQIFLGTAAGLFSAVAAGFLLTKIDLSGTGFDAVFVLGIAIFAYSVAVLTGGNGYLSVYIAGIFVGNSSVPGKKQLANFMNGITGLAQLLVFFLLGLLSTPSRIPEITLEALGIALFLALVARPAAVVLLMAPFKCSWRQIVLVSLAGLTGASSIVFAVVAVTTLQTGGYPPLGFDLYHIVFVIVLFSIGIKGFLLPRAAEKLNMIDSGYDIMSIFTGYEDKIPVHFLPLKVTAQHPWCGKKVRETVLPPGMLLVLLIRGSRHRIPTGETEIMEGDYLLLGTASAIDSAPETSQGTIAFAEYTVRQGDSRCGKDLRTAAADMEEPQLVILIKRGRKIIIPQGRTLIRAGDILVIEKNR